MSIHNYNSLTREIGRKQFNALLDDYFGRFTLAEVLHPLQDLDY